MLYQMRCGECGKELELGCPLAHFDAVIKAGQPCDCGGTMHQVITRPSHAFGRSPFPREGNEQFLPTPDGQDIRFQDKMHAREYLAEHGLVSGRVENDC